MTRTSLAEGRREEDRSSAERLAARIRQQVLKTLGMPPGWHLVQVRPLWDGYFRVNVLVGADITSFTVGHSFFLLANDAGDVIDSDPEMVKCY